MRWFTPVLFLGGAAGLHVYNTGGHGKVIAFFFLEDLLGLHGDLAAQGRATVYLMVILGVVLGILHAGRALRERRLLAEDAE